MTVTVKDIQAAAARLKGQVLGALLLEQLGGFARGHFLLVQGRVRVRPRGAQQPHVGGSYGTAAGNMVLGGVA